MGLFILVWTARNLLSVQEDTLFREVRGIETLAERAPFWTESLDLEQVPDRTPFRGAVKRPEETTEFAQDRVSFRSGKPWRFRSS